MELKGFWPANDGDGSVIATAVTVIWGSKCIVLYDAFINFYRLYHVYCSYVGA